MSGGFLPFVLDALGPLERVVARRMFSGHGLFRDGRMFAIIVDDTLYLKTDAGNRGAFEAAGSAPFTYARRDGRRIALSYFEAPAALLDDPDEALAWAREAIAAAERSGHARPVL